MEKYTIQDFKREFPDEKACLAYIFNRKYPNIKGYYYVKGRKCFANSKGKQIHPVKGTIFEHSSTPLILWFYAIYLFSASRNGISAKELQRQLGVTYKTAWRIGCQIRQLMKQDRKMLSGDVEVDETYFGGKDKRENEFKNKSAVMGMTERKGKIKAYQIEARQTHIILGKIKKNIKKDSTLITDEFNIYKKTPALGYRHKYVKHGKKKYAYGDVNTNSIEGFWGQLKRSVDGTYHSVSSKHLQTYVDEFSFRYNHRTSPVFEALMGRI